MALATSAIGTALDQLLTHNENTPIFKVLKLLRMIEPASSAILAAESPLKEVYEKTVVSWDSIRIGVILDKDSKKINGEMKVFWKGKKA